MAFEDLKDQMKSLSDEGLSKLIVHATHLKRLRDPETIAEMEQLLIKTDSQDRMSPDEFEALVKSI